MNKLVDAVCSGCGRRELDVWLIGGQLPTCQCGSATERLWAFAKAPGITPQGTRPHRGFDAPTQHVVDTKAIAAETKREVEDKWLRFSDERVAEEHVKREINHQAGWWDAAGNETPIPTPAPITFPKSEAMA